MRNRDEQKYEAIFEATVDLINTIGFEKISMSKIAKKADVAPATIYIYFENKEDLLKKVYLQIKKALSRSISANIHLDMPIKDALKMIMRTSLRYILDNQRYFLFLEQCEHSPLLRSISFFEQEELRQESAFLVQLIQQGQETGILKKVDYEFYLMYCSLPLMQLAKQHFHQHIPLSEEMFEALFQMSWDAIRENPTQ